jgi:hypothetical protein
MHLSVSVCPVMETRPCRFCLCLQGGSVFADLDVDAAGLVYLVRISCDGFGCCRLPASVERMNAEESALLLEAVSFERFDERVTSAFSEYLRRLRGVIWEDALIEHQLIDS